MYDVVAVVGVQGLLRLSIHIQCGAVCLSPVHDKPAMCCVVVFIIVSIQFLYSSSEAVRVSPVSSKFPDVSGEV